MQDTQQKPITGKENGAHQGTPYEALVDFYDAFNTRNLTKMSNNWAPSSEISMSNPLGGIMRGWDQIESVYNRIFNSPAQVYVEYYDYTIHDLGEAFFAVGRERGFMKWNGIQLDLAIRTSRVFQKIEGQWRQVHHHGSIDNPDLLEAYQSFTK